MKASSEWARWRTWVQRCWLRHLTNRNCGRQLAPLLIGLVLGVAGSAAAQSSLAVLRGTVSDPSQAVVPGVTVTLLEPATGRSVRTATTNATGDYEFRDLRPGSYELHFELTGFRPLVAAQVLLESGQTRRVDATLVLGGTEVITVTGGAATISNEAGSIAARFDKTQYADSPLIDLYPTPYARLTTLPGVQGSNIAGDLQIVGQGRNQQSQGFDGVSNDRTGEQSNNANFFEEVTITTVNAPAESARVVTSNLTSKRGENRLHGMVYYKHFNSALNAKSFFQREKTPFLQHEWQAEVSGPIVKGQTFFYATWVGQSIPKGSFQTASVPTLAFRRGDFSALSRGITDPLTGQPFPGNVIPAGRLSPVSSRLQELYYPLPNQGDPNSPVNNFAFTHPYNSDFYRGDWFLGRVDHHFSSANTIYARWLQRKTPYVLQSGLPDLVWTRLRDHQQFSIVDTHIFGRGVVNTASFGWARSFIVDGRDTAGERPIDGAEVLRQIGLVGSNPRGFSGQGFPTMNITGFSGLNTVNGGVKLDDDDFTFQDSVSWQVGRHVWKAGATYQTFRTFFGENPDYGSFTFDGSATGHAHADFLLGIPRTSTRLDPLVNRSRTAAELGLFVMDTFKISSRLTLEYGVRWDYFPSPRFEDGLVYNWDPATGSVIVPDEAARARVSPLYPRTINVVTGEVVPQADKANLRPRLSFAYRIRPDLVLRGGYGAFTERIPYFERTQGGGPYQIAETYDNVIRPGERPLLSFPNPYPDSLGRARVPSQNVSGYPRQTDNGTIHQFNLTTEKELAGLGLRASYIGSRGVGLNYALNINKPQPGTTPFAPGRRPYPQFVATTMVRSDGRSKYDAMQLEVRRRVGLLTFDAHYTLQRSTNNFSNLENPYDVLSHWTNDGPTRRHWAVVTTNWALPWGKGRRWMTDASPLVEHLLGGWTLQTISYFGSGMYFSPAFSGSDPSNTGTPGGLPDRVGDPVPAGGGTVERWFDPAAFAVPPAGRFGNAEPNSIEGQPLHVHHLSAAKRLSLTDRTGLTLTVAVSNLSNRAHFAPPRNNISAAGAGAFTAVVGQFLSPERAGFRQVTLKARFEF